MSEFNAAFTLFGNKRTHCKVLFEFRFDFIIRISFMLFFQNSPRAFLCEIIHSIYSNHFFKSAVQKHLERKLLGILPVDFMLFPVSFFEIRMFVKRSFSYFIERFIINTGNTVLRGNINISHTADIKNDRRRECIPKLFLFAFKLIRQFIAPFCTAGMNRLVCVTPLLYLALSPLESTRCHIIARTYVFKVVSVS